jgi:hypothetical protein
MDSNLAVPAPAAPGTLKRITSCKQPSRPLTPQAWQKSPHSWLTTTSWVAADAEFSLSEGNGAVIELAARDSLRGVTQTFEISDAGLDSKNVEIDE